MVRVLLIASTIMEVPLMKILAMVRSTLYATLKVIVLIGVLMWGQIMSGKDEKLARNFNEYGHKRIGCTSGQCHICIGFSC